MKHTPFAISFLFVVLMVGTLTKPALGANSPDAYADVVYNTSAMNMYNAAAGVGAPDNNFAQFFGRDTHVTLDMGADEEGIGNLTLHLVLLDFGATYRVTFYDEQMTELDTYAQSIPLNTTQVIIPYDGAFPYRYVRVASVEENLWKLDAIEAADYQGRDPLVEAPGADEQSDQQIAPSYKQGDLVKLKNDGNPQTSHDAAVYLIGADNKRHAFPNETIFTSWFADFDGVREVDADTLASFALGKNVTMRPGTYLIKLANDPKVYAVAEGGVLRWLNQEWIANALYGKNWSQRVVDMPDVFFTNYTQGKAVETELYPDGTVGTVANGDILYLRNGYAYEVGAEVRGPMRLRSAYFVSIKESVRSLYLGGGNLVVDPALQWPY